MFVAYAFPLRRRHELYNPESRETLERTAYYTVVHYGGINKIMFRKSIDYKQNCVPAI